MELPDPGLKKELDSTQFFVKESSRANQFVIRTQSLTLNCAG